MENDHSLKAFGWTLLAICYLLTLGVALCYVGKYMDALPLGAAVVGLIGVIKLPAANSVRIDNPASDPVPVTKAGE